MSDIFLFRLLDRMKGYGTFFVRIVFGLHLIFLSQDNLFSYDRMIDYAGYLEKLGFPMSFFFAIISVSFQFTCGLLWVLGYKVRLAGFLMTIHFLLAVVMGHLLLADDYMTTTPALFILAVSLLLFFNGAGKLSIDEGI